VDYQTDRLSLRLALGAAVLTCILTLVALAMSVTTLPHSGPSCTFDTCVEYPYTDVADYYPRDYLWMIPATLLLLPFIALVGFLHSYASEDRKAFALLGLALASISAAILSATYFIQLTVIQPSLVRGETDGLSPWSQYNPHGVFIALESVGYSFMSAALLPLAPLFRGSGIKRAIRCLFAAAPALALLSFVGLVAAYGNDLEYRFEIAVISISWIALGLGSLLMAVQFARDARPRDTNRS
jgi:hypothetical protein